MAIRVWKDIPLVRRAGGHFPLGRGNPMDNAITKYSEDVATASAISADPPRGGNAVRKCAVFPDSEGDVKTARRSA